jgi:tetratricopeptide (TPR) repeat protein
MLLTCGLPLLKAQRILLSEKDSTQVRLALQAQSEQATPEIRPASASESFKVVVIAEWLDRSDLPALFAWLRKQAGRSQRRTDWNIWVLREQQLIAVPGGGGFVQLESRVRQLLDSELSSSGEPGSLLRILDLLASSIGESADDWSRLVWAGRFPDLPQGLLKEYAQARLFTLLSRGRSWLLIWPPQDTAWLPTLGDFPDPPRVEISWTPQPVDAEPEIRSVEFQGMTLRYLAAGPEASLPTFEALGRLVEAEARARLESAGAPELAALRREHAAFPTWRPALLTGARLAERLKDYATAAVFLESLARKLPDDPEIWQRYAIAVSESAPPAAAEVVLRRAVRVAPGVPELWERLARSRLSQDDAAEAYKLLLHSLELQPNRPLLWWEAADLANKLGDSAGERRALHEGLKLQRERLDRWARYITLALEAGDKEGAQDALRASESMVPENAALLDQYARFFEAVGDVSRSLQFWQRTVRADPALEAGWIGIARLEAAAGNWNESLKAATEGLERVPKSTTLRVARAEALLVLGAHQEARATLRAAGDGPQEIALLRLRARVEDLFGGEEAGKAWDRLLQAESGLDPAEVTQNRRRALLSALRDDRFASAVRLLGFAGAGRSPETASSQNAVVIPGGVALLQHLSGVSGPDEPERYLLVFARAVADQSSTEGPARWDRRVQSLIEHYERLDELRRLGRSEPGSTTITIELGGRAELQRSRRILELLGYRLRGSNRDMRLEAPADGAMARRQSLAGALDIDERQLAEALRARRPFVFVIKDEAASNVLGEAWLELLARHANALGFAGMLAREPRLARLYAGLSSMSRRAAEALGSRLGLQRLATEYADLLYLYGPALALDDEGRCPAPGGRAAEGAWQALAGVSPRQGVQFIEALLRKHDGALLAYFAQLHAITPDRQNWFLRTPERARRFYELARTSAGWGAGPDRRLRRNPLADLFRDLPLDRSGSVRFPGGPEVWQVTRGASDLSRVAKLAKRTRRVQPAEEEAIIERLARERYEVYDSHSQLENFLAVVHLEQAFGRDLSPREALMLAEQFPRYVWAVPFLTALAGLGETELSAFFSWAQRLPEDPLEANHALGLWENIVLLEGLLVRAGRLSGSASASIFRQLCDDLRLAPGRGVRAAAAARALRTLAQAIGAEAGSLEKALQDALLGPPESLLGRQRRLELKEVLRLQQIPSLDLVLALFNAGESATNASAARRTADLIEQSVAALPVVAVPKSVDSSAAGLGQYLRQWKTEDLLRIVRDLRRRTAQRSPNPRDLESLKVRLCDALSPWLELALRGFVFGLYFRPSDLVISEDPLFVRKHQYRDLVEWLGQPFPPPDLSVNSQQAGSIPRGSLAGLWTIAGRAAALSQRSASPAAFTVEAMQLGTIRNAFLWRLSASDLRTAHLAVLAGREWVVEAAFSAEQARDLLAASEGLLSLHRRTLLREALVDLQGLHAEKPPHNFSPVRYQQLWKTVWDAMSFSDLYWLGWSRSRISEVSAAAAALRQFASLDGQRGGLNELGIVPLRLHYTFVPRMAPLPPYEDYAQRLRLEDLGERLAEFLLPLACIVDQVGLPPEAVGLIAEPMLQRVLRGAVVADPWDFQSIQSAWKRLSPAEVAGAYAEYVRVPR